MIYPITAPNYDITILMWTLTKAQTTKGYLHLNLAIFLKLITTRKTVLYNFSIVI